MIFYTAIADDGTTQLRGTQADARAVNKNFEQIDIPTDKAGLMAFVQELYAEIDELRRDIAVEVGAEIASGHSGPDAAAVPEAPTPPPETAPLPTNDDDPIEDEGLNIPVLESQVSALGVVGGAALDLFDGWETRVGISPAFSRGVHLLSIIASGEHQLASIMLRERRKKFGQRS